MKLKFLLQLKLLWLVFIFINGQQNTFNSYATPWNSNGNGNVMYLDRHFSYCPAGQAMSNVRLQSSGSNINFIFGCLQGLSMINKISVFYTDWNATDKEINESSNYLDRHLLKCPLDSALNGFNLETSNRNIRFKYTCLPVKYERPGNYYTEWTNMDNRQIQYLNMQNISVPDKTSKMQVLQGFRMHTKYYKSCFFCDEHMDIRFNIEYMILRNFSTDE